MNRLAIAIFVSFSWFLCGPLAAEQPVKVFVLAGQSNMVGHARVSLLEHQITDPATREIFAHLHDNGEFVVRDDVFIKFLDRYGKLTVGFGARDKIGPELEFGHTVGNHYDEPVLLIKSAWGGKSLYRDFRPPSAGEADESIIGQQLENLRKKNPDATMDEVMQTYGVNFRAMIDDIQQTLDNIAEYVPDYNNRGYELAGFVWFQGWNDMINDEFTAAYTDNMAHFIRDVRVQLKSPELPFVVGVLGVGGTAEERPSPKKDQFKQAQAAVGEMDEFRGNVTIVHTDQYWDMEADAVFKKGWRENFEAWEKVGSDRPYHYLGSVKCYSRIGRAFAEALIAMDDQ